MTIARVMAAEEAVERQVSAHDGRQPALPSAPDSMAWLRSRQERVLDTLAEGVILYGVIPGRPLVELANAAACRLLRMNEAELRSVADPDRALPAMCDAEGQPLTLQDLPASVTARTGVSVSDFVWGLRHDDGELTWLSSTSRPFLDEAGTMTGVVLSMVDVTERYKTGRELEAAHGRFAALLEHSSDVICVLDADAVVRYASPAFLTVWGQAPVDQVGRALTELLHLEDRARFLGVLRDVAQCPDQIRTAEFRVVQPAGDLRHIELTATNRVCDPSVGGIVINSHDITDRVETATRLAFDATHDGLTGLPNRALLLERLERSLHLTGAGCALLFVDFDHFKHINDSYGHATGDELLMAIATRLVDVLRPGDTVARIGGDEFVILADGVTSIEVARELAARVRVTVGEPEVLAGRPITVDCSIGIALSDGSSPEVLLQQADTALYRAKGRGRGRAEIYDHAMRLHARRRVQTEAMLRQALDNGNVVVHYQPIVALATSRVVATEALARIRDDQGELVPPDQFIPVAEDSGLIIPLGADVLRQACAQQARRMAAGPDAPAHVAVNLAAGQLLSPGIIADIVGALEAAELPPTALCLELTETTLIRADRATYEVFANLTNLGIRLALDDFGTGWSSLAHLRRYPISILKIDRSFVSGIGADRGDTEVVKAVVGLGLALGLDIVAEGVETPEQARFLAGLGCPHVQGYLYGRPGPEGLGPTG
jgi:diguanylate cyclase (GGDEF)-like protein/PAS domain S-box-containing protein